MRKASEDVHAAEVLDQDPTVADDIVGFHCQQAVEKALKAVLLEKQVYFPRTHNLTYLAGLIGQVGMALPVGIAQLAELNAFAVDLRYMDLDASASFDRATSMEMAHAVHAWASAQVPAP